LVTVPFLLFFVVLTFGELSRAAALCEQLLGVNCTMRTQFNRKKIMNYLVRYAIVLLALIFFLFPIFWITMMAFKSPDEYFRNPPVWLPRAFMLDHFQQLLTNKSANALGRSLLVTVSSSL